MVDGGDGGDGGEGDGDGGRGGRRIFLNLFLVTIGERRRVAAVRMVSLSMHGMKIKYARAPNVHTFAYKHNVRQMALVLTTKRNNNNNNNKTRTKKKI